MWSQFRPPSSAFHCSRHQHAAGSAAGVSYSAVRKYTGSKIKINRRNNFLSNSNTEKILQQEDHYRSQPGVACRSRNSQRLNYNGRLVAALACYKNLFFGLTIRTTGNEETDCQKTIFYSVVETSVKKERAENFLNYEVPEAGLQAHKSVQYWKKLIYKNRKREGKTFILLLIKF